MRGLFKGLNLVVYFSAFSTCFLLFSSQAFADDYAEVRLFDVSFLGAGITTTVPPTGVSLCGAGKISLNGTKSYKRVCFSHVEKETDRRSTEFINRCVDLARSLIQIKQLNPKSKAYLSIPGEIPANYLQDFGDGTAHMWSGKVFNCDLMIDPSKF